MTTLDMTTLDIELHAAALEAMFSLVGKQEQHIKGPCWLLSRSAARSHPVACGVFIGHSLDIQTGESRSFRDWACAADLPPSGPEE